VVAEVGQAFCVRESLTLAPEIVAVSTETGAMRTLVRPNSRYDEIIPLRSEKLEWVNRYGNRNDGYLTYPRNFDSHQRYPVILVTHSGDAYNRFAAADFQWEFPVQVFAEQGYLVLSVNEPRASAKTQAARESFDGTGAKVGVELQQFAHGFDAIASMEVALQSVIDRGIADPARTGIAGYSRGSEVTELVMTQSKLFKVASDGDAGGWNAGVFWAYGSLEYRHSYELLYGGSPYDPRYLENYRRYSPSMRVAEFAGPLLQQFTAANAPVGLELHSLLQDAGVPTELVSFPHESHIFWQPRHRFYAMQRNLDWFDYWLLGKRRAGAEEAAQYARWDEMAKKWTARADRR
jgi:dipeptidyl aminopeptidase/acylaminoacyl peptidase